MKMESELICVVCNAIFSSSSELIPHQTLHSMHNLSQALVHMQILLIQCTSKIKKLQNSDELSDGTTTKGAQTKKKQHFLFNVMSIRDIDILFETPTKVQTFDTNCKVDSDIDETSVHDDNNVDEVEENSVIIQNKSRKDVTNVENSLSKFCNLCKKSFSSKANLKKHQIIHNNDKPWKCELCDKTFNQKRDHNYHMARQHTMKRPNICTDCGKGFVLKSSLKEHIKIHTGERHFQCKICQKRFLSSSGLSKHNKRHDDTRTFVCMLCPQDKPKAFKVNIDLLAHVKKVHMKKPNRKTKNKTKT